MNRGKLCISVCAGTAVGTIAAVRAVRAQADIIEIRFDCLRPEELGAFADADRPEWREIVAAANGTPIITTFRPREESGMREISRDERVAFFLRSHGTEFCDVEADIIAQLPPHDGRTRICSKHFPNDITPDVDSAYDALRSTGADIIKVAMHAEDAVDALPVWKLLDRAANDGVGIIPVAMGDAGQWTRILGPAHGSFLTYASLDDTAGTAAGQISASEMRDVYRVGGLTRDTRVFAVIGDPVSASRSPHMHNRAFAETGIDAVFLRMKVVDLDAFMRRMVHIDTREAVLNFGGFSVTMPHKIAVMRHLDHVDAIAEQAGAVNTVVIEDGRLIGSNSDVAGFIAPLLERMGDIAGSRAAVFGAGGASRACIAALTNAGAEVTVFARDITKAAALADRFPVAVRPMASAKVSGIDVVVNATPVGMPGRSENDSILSSEQLAGVKCVYDIVTRPTDTPLIAGARQAGAVTIGGVEMLIAQGVRQFELWTGQKAPSDAMREAVLGELRKRIGGNAK